MVCRVGWPVGCWFMCKTFSFPAYYANKAACCGGAHWVCIMRLFPLCTAPANLRLTLSVSSTPDVVGRKRGILSVIDILCYINLSTGTLCVISSAAGSVEFGIDFSIVLLLQARTAVVDS